MNMSLRKLDKNFKIAIMALALTTIAACIFGGFTLLMSKTKLELFNNGTVNTLILEIIVTIVPCLVVKKNSGGKFNLELISMKFEGNSLSDLFKGMGISILMITTLVVVLMVTKIISIKGLGFEFAAVNKVIWSIFLVSLVAIFAGICEEIFCRGILLNYLAKWKGEIFALIVSSIIFTAFHITRYQDINSLTNVFLMGIILGRLL
ncbi:CPBP family intramembrane metalloprotease [Clostridium sp. CT7]|nr:CPBP family intramembrane metalloprotease [Clostridium sp. CT7]